jgi:hypothetical protein
MVLTKNSLISYLNLASLLQRKLLLEVGGSFLTLLLPIIAGLVKTFLWKEWLNATN